MSMSNHEAAVLLGMADNEVVSVEATGDGPIITTFDGQSYIVVDGKVMWFRPPAATGRTNPGYGGSLPVYGGPQAVDAGHVSSEEFMYASKVADPREVTAPVKPLDDDDDKPVVLDEDNAAEKDDAAEKAKTAAHVTEPDSPAHPRARNRGGR